MKLELTVWELRELASGAHEPEQKLRDVTNYPPLEWSLNIANGRLVESSFAADVSLPLYEVWHNGDEWLAMEANKTAEPIADGSLVFCLDRCREDFMDKIDADRAAGKVS